MTTYLCTLCKRCIYHCACVVARYEPEEKPCWQCEKDNKAFEAAKDLKLSRKVSWIKRAESAIRRNTLDVYDYASSIGQIVDNVKHTTTFIKGLAHWLEEHQ